MRQGPPNQAMERTAPPLRERDFVNVHQTAQYPIKSD